MDTIEIEPALGPWSAGRGPLHRKLSGALREAIARGDLRPGTRLPSERDLARRLMVSRTTVVAAYDHLRSDGLLSSQRGSGTRVAASPKRAAGAPVDDEPLNPVYRSLLAEPGDLISLAAACSPAHPLVAEAMGRVVADDSARLVAHNGYLPFGLPELRAGLADMHSSRGLPTTPDQVLVTTGAQQGVSLAAALLVRPGDTVVVESPNFAGTLDAFRAVRARLAAVAIDDDGVDPAGVADLMGRVDPALVYLMPSFHNPTGVALSERRRERVAQIVTDTGVPLLEDNALEHTPLGDDAPPPVASYAPATAPVLTVGSFSKLAWGGLRIGWVRGPAALIDRLGLLKTRADLGTPLFDQAVANRLLPELDQLRHDRRAETQAALARVGELLRSWLPGWEWQPPQGGPSLWIRLPRGTASGFAQVALRYGIEVIPGEVMSPTGDHRQHLRFPFTVHPELQETVIRRLADAWEAYTGTRFAHDAGANVVV